MASGRGRRAWVAVCAAASMGAVAVPARAAALYDPGERRCGFADGRIDESSGVAVASWDSDIIWTHNDSGDGPRFFAVEVRRCTTVATYDVTGAEAVDWEDMAAKDGTLYLGDIGDNPSTRESVTVYDVPEPPAGTPSGPVRPTATRVLTYPDGAHNAESLLVDPTTGRLVIVTKTRTGPSVAYRAPAEGSGTMERVAAVAIPGPTTGGDATAERIVIRTYGGAYEWDVRPGDTLAATLARAPAPVALPVTKQGEAIAYAGDGSGLWTTSEGEGGPVHFLGRLAAPETPLPASGGETGAAEESEVPLAVAAAVLAGLLVAARALLRRRAAASGIVDARPAYYAARPGGWGDWWTILHPPYTAWHLSYVVLGASLAPDVDGARLVATTVAFLLAVGVAAHALDEWRGRPLRTSVPDAALVAAAAVSLAAAVLIGVAGVTRVGLILVPFIVAGPVVVVAYNLELFGGRLHTDTGFALSWGGFPLLTAYVAQAEQVDAPAVLAAAGAVALARAQRSLSTRARLLRRKVSHVQGTLTHADGTVTELDRRFLLGPLEEGLRFLSWSVVLTATAFAVARLA
ncbi:MAG: hypothetical protein ACRDY7_01025 [Acidimicrobiia bacterium]